MKQENKELLLKDLCTRIPYGVKGIDCNGNISSPKDWKTEFHILTAINYRITKYEWRPYLFPLSSMTEEQKKDLLLTTVGEKGLKLFSVTKDGIISNDKEEQSFANFSINWINFSNKNVKAYIGWLIKNHFDIHDLIPMGLAIDATELSIYE